MTKLYNILYVDDEVSNLNVFKNTFRRNYNIFTAESASEGLEILDREKIDLILTDQRMPEMSGVDFLKNVIKKHPEPNRILITAFSDFNAIKDAINEAKIFQYIQKPWDEKEIQKIIDNALEIYQLKQRNIELTIELEKRNAELARLNQDLLDLDAIKLQFLRIISHEIRTPLNGLIGATSIFKQALSEEESEKKNRLFWMLESNTERLANFLLLAERITMFKIDQYKVKPEKLILNNLLLSSLEAFSAEIKECSLTVNSTFCRDEESRSLAEKQLIEFCFRELLDNAIKHSEPGGTITLKSVCDPEYIHFVIEDSGKGFPEIVLKNLYKPFITDDDLSNQGMGLDLALVKLIVEAHNGEIDIRNNEGKGSTIKVSLRKII